MDIDAVGTFTMCHEAVKYLKKGGPGRTSSCTGGLILNISATLHYTASWYQIHVSAAKVCGFDASHEYHSIFYRIPRQNFYRSL